MPLSPNYKVKLEANDFDLTSYVTSLKYEDSLKDDDFVSINMDGVTIDFLNQNQCKQGAKIIFEFGFLDGKRSGQRYAVIKNIDYDYGTTIKLIIKCHDKGSWMKKLTSKQHWKDMRASDMVQAIANMFGCQAVIDPTETVYTSIPQAGKTFHEFCRYLANKEGYSQTDLVFKDKNSSSVQQLNKIAAERWKINGFYEQASTVTGRNAIRQKYKDKPIYAEILKGFDTAIAINGVQDVGKTYVKGAYEFYVRGNTLYFVKRDLSGESKSTYTYTDGNGIVKGFKVATKEAGDGSGKSASIGTQGINPETNEVFDVKNDSKNTTETGLGDDMLHFDVMGELIPNNIVDMTKIEGSTNFSTGNTDTDVKKKASSKKLKSSKNEVTATLSLDLEPERKAGDIISVAGVAVIHCGNWRVEKASHDVTPNSGTMLELVKNAGNLGQGGSSSAASNTSTGDAAGNGNGEGGNKNETGEEIDRVEFDVDGNEKGKKEKGYGLKGSGGKANVKNKTQNT
jgi:phage protein D